MLPGLVDHHVHLGLVDAQTLAGSALIEAHDLGWSPDEAVRFRARPPAGLRVKIAGPFHTAVGGYPAGRAWARPSAVRQLADASDVRRALAAAARADYDMIKVALHAGMVLLDDRLLGQLIDGAHAGGRSVVVHAEGPGQAARAIAAGADTFAHTPWTEPLSDALLARSTHMTWISTLAIHRGAHRTTAVDNLRRFHGFGGRVVYGTDMGNGPTPAGVNVAEIEALGEAGLHGEALLSALTGRPPAAPLDERAPAADRLSSPHPRPHTAADVITWLQDAVRLPPAPLEEHDATA